jgi:hypothetical protein
MASLNRHRLGRTGIRLTKSSHEAREQNRGKYNYSNREQVALRQKTRVPFFREQVALRQKTRVPFSRLFGGGDIRVVGCRDGWLYLKVDFQAFKGDDRCGSSRSNRCWPTVASC